MIDLDHFKDINDRHGHAAGDLVLTEVARRLSARLSPADLIARIGGEEFLIALPDATLGTARMTAERLCKVIAGDPVPLPGGRGAVQVTISVGLALGPGLGPDPAEGLARDALSRADAALMAAKAEGRNQVTVASAA